MLTIIGDVHGLTDQYIKIARKREYSLQIGDMNFSYTHMKALDPDKHKFFAGNHDNYDLVGSCPNNIGDYGYRNIDGVSFFFVRGGISTDRHMRTEGKSWWRNEELSYREASEAVQMYREYKPDLMITHQPPESVVAPMGFHRIFPSLTGQLLNELLDIHRPKIWVFGHMHISWEGKIGNTKFKCLNELETMELKPMYREKD